MSVTRSPEGTLVSATIDPPLWLGLAALDIAREAPALISQTRSVARGTPNEHLARAALRVVSSALARLPGAWRAELSDDRVDLWCNGPAPDVRTGEATAEAVADALAALSLEHGSAWLRTLVGAWRDASAHLGANFDEGLLSLSQTARGARLEARTCFEDGGIRTVIRIAAMTGELSPEHAGLALPEPLSALGFRMKHDAGTVLLERDGLLSDGRALADAWRAASELAGVWVPRGPYR